LQFKQRNIYRSAQLTLINSDIELLLWCVKYYIFVEKKHQTNSRMFTHSKIKEEKNAYLENRGILQI
jgi:hypothetical protein